MFQRTITNSLSQSIKYNTQLVKHLSTNQTQNQVTIKTWGDVLLQLKMENNITPKSDSAYASAYGYAQKSNMVPKFWQSTNEIQLISLSR